MLTQLSKQQVEISYLANPPATDGGENRVGYDVKQGLTQCPKSLPSQYFYDDRGSELFEQICELPEYYPTRTEASILEVYGKEIAQITGLCELIELGSGSSTKTRLLLNAYQDQGNIYKYVPIDVSAGILKASAMKLTQEYPTLKIQGLVGTYEQALTQFQDDSSQVKMLFFLGSSIGNFSPVDYDKFLHKIRAVLKEGDYFLLGIDLQKPEEILEAAYNDSQGITAGFNLNILAHLNYKFQGNFDLNHFCHRAIYNPQKNQIEMYLISQKKQLIGLRNLDLTIAFQEKETILTEISRKFDLNEVKRNLEMKGMKTLKIFTDPRNWFGLVLCQVVDNQ